MASPASVIGVEYRGRVAVLTIDNEAKLNALSQAQYYDLAQRMREVTARDDVYITLLIGKGRYFSAGADVSLARDGPSSPSSDTAPLTPSDASHAYWLRNFVASNLNTTQAFYSHPKILVVGLNGPVIGLSAALVGFADFVYATPSTFLLTPFSSLGLVAEGGASRGLVQRLGVARASEALIMSKRLDVSELLAAGFVNKVFDPSEGDFKTAVLREIDERLGDHLVGDSLLGIKALMRRPERAVLDAQNVAEVFAGLDRFVAGVPQEEFLKIATGKKRHKL